MDYLAKVTRKKATSKKLMLFFSHCEEAAGGPPLAEHSRISATAFSGTTTTTTLCFVDTNDGIVNFKDFAAQVRDWQTSRHEQPGDLNRDGIIDIADLGLMAEEWLEETRWAGP